MKEARGRVAVVTGAASGIGRGLSEIFAEAGMKVVLADVEAAALEKTAAELVGKGHDVFGVVTDVGKMESVEALAREAEAKYGRVHVLCNNAGIASGAGPLWENRIDEWEWTVRVNLMGVVHGIRAFVPAMLAHGEEGHVVNTASVAGLIPGGMAAAYTATKFAVVGLTESLYGQFRLVGARLSASVLCPAWVNTKIAESERNRPRDMGEAAGLNAQTEAVHGWVTDQLRAGLDPRDVAAQVLDAIRSDRFYVLTHPAWNPMIEQRCAALLKGENPPMLMPPNGESLMQRLAAAAQR